MRLKEEFIVYGAGDESMLVPTGQAAFAGLVKGNKTLGAILDQLKADTTEEAIVASLATRYDAPETLIARDVRRALEELRAIGALDE